MISVFGSTGFIGTRFCEMYPDEVLPVPRDEFISEDADQVLYLISTTHNYDTWEVNIETNINHLLKVLQHHDPKCTFNFISSWFVYGDVKNPVVEREIPNPKGGNYNLTKLWAEQLVQDFCREHEIPWRIFRLANVFGEGDTFSKQKNALQYLINEMKYDRDIELYNNGIFYRDYIYIDDLCMMLSKGMKLFWDNSIYNIGSGDPVLFHDFIFLAREILGSKSKITNIEASKFHDDIQVRSFQMSTGKANAFGVCCKTSPYVRLYRMLKNDR